MTNAKQTHYVGSAGLAFAERIEMNKLSRLAAKGWLLESFAFLGYRLRRGTPRNLVYVLDIRRLKQDEREEYFHIFEAGGWQHVCSQGELHIFAAEPGTEAIYTDPSTARDKYARAVRVGQSATLLMAALTLAGSGLRYAGEVWGNSTLIPYIGVGASLVGLTLLVPSIMVYAAYWLRLRFSKA
ncbi:DUF2812 domain-containing protein [Paenibacillus filicis]|uniref:DUF2812 domain-containing protein n=1 Tax=Paenibacillus filicis TaxID=669464 RepID=A0ABU9DCI5_9BACL